MGVPDYQVSDNLKEAVRLHRRGNLDAARQIYLRILGLHPENPDATHLLGVIAHQGGELDKAVQLISRAIELAPEEASYYLNLGNTYMQGNLLEQAVTCFKKAVDIKPDYADAYYNLANALSAQGKYDSAVPFYQDAVELKPELTEAYLNIGHIFEQQGDIKQAVSWYTNALQSDPDCLEACIHLGSLHQKLNNHSQAIRCFQRAAAANSKDCYRLYNNMGASHQALGNKNDAVKCFEKAITANPDYAPAYYNLGIEYHLSGQLDKSIHALEQALALRPAHCDALNLLLHLLQRTCDWHKMNLFAPQLDRLTAGALKSQTSTAEAVYTNVLRHADPALNFCLARNRSRTIVQQVSDVRTNFNHDGSIAALKKITLGYFSADFRNHPIAHLICGLFRLHDRAQFRVYCYSYGQDDASQYRHQIMRDCDRFVDVQQMSNRDIADRIYADGVCILIDLTGHTAGNRLEVCALRPAPIQVSYLGFPGTTGADFMDYIITDKIVSPLEHEPFYSEKLVYMPDCYQVNNNDQEMADTDFQRTDFGLPEN